MDFLNKRILIFRCREKEWKKIIQVLYKRVFGWLLFPDGSWFNLDFYNKTWW